MSARWFAGALAQVLMLVLCARVALAGASAPQEYLDEKTAATITVVGEPLVFAAARPDLAANVRDYVTLAAAAINRSGKMSYVLIAYFWSTVDPRLRSAELLVADPLVLHADDRLLELSSRGQTAREMGIASPVHAPPGTSEQPHAYVTDLATLRFIAEARRLHIVADVKTEPLGSFQLWQDGRAALRELVRQQGGAP